MTKTMTSLRQQLQRPELVAAAVLLSLAVIPIIPLFYADLLGVPTIVITFIGIVQAYRSHNLVRTALALVATALVLLATWLIADQVSADVHSSGYLQCAVVLDSAAVLAGLAGIALLFSRRKIGGLGLIAAGALRLGADCMTAAVQAQANPAGDEDWSGLGDVIGAMMFGIIGCTFAALSAAIVFRRAQNKTVCKVATWDSPSRW